MFVFQHKTNVSRHASKSKGCSLNQPKQNLRLSFIWEMKRFCFFSCHCHVRGLLLALIMTEDTRDDVHSCGAFQVNIQ